MKCKKIFQFVIFITGTAMIGYGVIRGEAAAVFGKAEYGDGYRQLPHYLPISIFPIYLKAKYIRARLKQYVCQD